MSSTVRLSGQLSRDAVSFFDPKTQESKVRLLIEQRTCAVPYLVTHSYGTGSSAGFIASRAAKQLRKGTPVVAHGEGLRQKRYDSQTVLELLQTSHLELPLSNARYAETSESESAA